MAVGKEGERSAGCRTSGVIGAAVSEYRVTLWPSSGSLSELPSNMTALRWCDGFVVNADAVTEVEHGSAAAACVEFRGASQLCEFETVGMEPDTESTLIFRVPYMIGHFICRDVAQTLSAVAYQLHRCTPYCDNLFSSTSLSLVSLSRSLALSSP